MTYTNGDTFHSMKASRDWYWIQLLQTNRKYEELLKKYVDHDVERLQAEVQEARKGLDSYHQHLSEKLEQQERFIEDMCLTDQAKSLEMEYMVTIPEELDYLREDIKQVMERSDFIDEFETLVRKYALGE